SGPDKLTKKEINFWRSKVDDFDRSIREQKSRVAELRRKLEGRDAEIESLTERERERSLALEPSERTIAELESRNAGLDARIEEQAARIGELEGKLAEAEAARAEGERLQETLKERDARVMQLAAELEAVKAELAAQNEQRQKLEAELEQKDQERQSVAAELAAAREQISDLEQELRDEKECTDNLSEVANERRELITSLEDRLAEAEERYEEARWRLGKAQHFERLVKRRKKLIKALIERIRQKHKANVALKAGLDGLRTYKAAAEAKQHELLKRIDKLTAKVKEHEETIARHHASTVAKEELFGAQSRINELEKRIEAQVEIIQTLEDELKTAKAMQQVRADYGAEVERLRNEVSRLTTELDAKTKIVERLES